MQQEMILTTLGQLQALAHPIRQNILRILDEVPQTNKQMAERLQISPGRLHFHVRELEQNGLIEMVQEVPKGGVIEKYYLATAHNYTLGHLLGANREAGETLVSSTLIAARDEYLRSLNGVPSGSTVHLSLYSGQALLTREEVEEVDALRGQIDHLFKQAEKDAEKDKTGRILHNMTIFFHSAEPVTESSARIQIDVSDQVAESA